VPFNDDTQSEDSMDDVITQQLKKEKRRKAADEEDAKAKKLTDAIDNLGNINLSVYQQYL
jgi:hypothetical protein